jgi:hypothetical protein
MNKSPRPFLLLSVAILACVSCSTLEPTNRNGFNRLKKMDIPALCDDARLTAKLHMKRGGGVTIPKSLWQGSVLRLNPVRIYSHQWNLALVLKESDLAEEGIYLGGWADSSFAPVFSLGAKTSRPSSDGYVFTQTENGYLTFTKSKTNNTIEDTSR